MRLSRILLLVIALVAGGLAAFLATRPGEAPPGQAPIIVEADTTRVLVATAPIGMGERLSETNMAWQDWPTTALREDYIDVSAMPEALTDMRGSVARFEMFEGDPIRQQKLIKADQGYLSAVLDKGMRGVSISVTADSASGGFIVPNDHVDVILTRAGSAAEGGQVVETILSNVRVLAINTRLGELGTTGAAADPANPRAEIFADTAIATLELDPIQAETVINAGQTGKLSLSLRSIVDFAGAPGDEALPARNAPIKIIRYGVEANVMAGAPASADVQLGPAAYSPPINQPVSTETAPVLE